MILVHTYGVPAQIDKILKITSKYKIKLIEDAAGAFGSEVNDVKLGTIGDYGVFSFNGNKMITTGSGGLLLSKASGDEKKAKFLSTQAKEETVGYEHQTLGYNYVMNNLSAAMGRGQLKYVEALVSRKIEIYQAYFKGLKTANISFIEDKNGLFINRWLTCIIFESFELKEKIRNHLITKNMESRCTWKPMHLQPLYSKEISYVNGNSEAIFSKGLCLPSDTNMSVAQQKEVIKEILNCLNLTD